MINIKNIYKQLKIIKTNNINQIKFWNKFKNKKNKLLEIRNNLKLNLIYY